MSQKFISHPYEEFMKYQCLNNVLPQSLVSHCVNDMHNETPNMLTFDEEMREIVMNITKGSNPNSVIFRNQIKFFVNKINQGTYNEFLEKIKKLIDPEPSASKELSEFQGKDKVKKMSYSDQKDNIDFSSKENINFFASELIICAMRCPISVKGFTFTEDSKYKSVPEVCMDVAKYFSFSYDNKNINFREELIKICEHFFNDFIDLNKSLDENNEGTYENFKGFMTVMGLLYSRQIISINIVISCIDIIKRSIFSSECKSKKHGEFIQPHSCTEHNKKLTGVTKQVTNKFLKSICHYDCDYCEVMSDKTPQITYRSQFECTNLHKGYELLISHVINYLEKKTDELMSHLKEKKKYITIYTGLINKVNDNKLDNIDVMNYLENKKQKGSIKNENKEEILLLLNEDKDKVTEHQKQIETLLNKLKDCLTAICKHHNDMTKLNNCYVSIVKGQQVNPLKPNNVFIHNEIGNRLNSLNDKLSKI